MTAPPPLPPDHAVNHARARAAGDLDLQLRVTVSPERRLTNAVLWGHLSDELIAAVDLDQIYNGWCRMVIAAVIVLRDENTEITLTTVHQVLADAGVHRGPDDAWWLAMADVTAGDGRLDENAAAVYLEQVRVEHLRRVGHQALVRTAHRLETSTDPRQVLADLAHDVGEA